MSQSNEQIVHNAVNAIHDGETAPWSGNVGLSVHIMEQAHALLPRVSGSAMACATLADLMVACYQLGMSRALASVAAGLEEPR